MQIVRCISCDGYSWYTDDLSGEHADCDWCGGNGYVYRDADGVDHRIPESDYDAVADILEKLELERMRELGYQGQAKKPWEQAVRRDTTLGERRPPDDTAT